MTDPAPPRKRYTLELTAHAHDMAGLRRILKDIAADTVPERPLPLTRVSSGGYWFKVTDLGTDRTEAAAYEADLEQFALRRLGRRCNEVDETVRQGHELQADR